jgi:homoserine kinase
VKSKCKNAGALGGGISGSGPSIFMLSKEEETADKVEAIMKEIYEKIGVDYKTYVTQINPHGVKILE